ncbi:MULTISPECIES: hypothetical protein [unclassified Streptomyces]|uniref:hypothetical protein n=1 Tax=unclassified Streptomyces TaxID=2593676 RepID=UPI0016615FD5|nr:MULTISPECIES: hypothetical protein [unclassified Streptomyces]MBD0706859.1 hypothetical protein [Streptomyces sp. CBMA291]MBD0714995.1 hypothetical protein [Streptomyces sp. CBMA370]
MTTAAPLRPTTPDSYRERVLRAAADTRLPDLDALVDGEPLFRSTSPEGLLTLTVRGAQLPAAYLDDVYRFRLAQYLKRGWIDEDLAAAAGLAVEPYDTHALEDQHTLVVETETGILRGYGTLARTRSPEHTLLGDDTHLPFVVERDYGLRLADELGATTPSNRVWEGKRLMRDYAMERSQAAVSVPWWVYRGWAEGCLKALAEEGAAIVGDGKPNGAILQLSLLGFHARTLDVPALAVDPGDLFAPMWDQQQRSYPFVLTGSDALRPTLDHLDAVLASGTPGSVAARLTAFREARA